MYTKYMSIKINKVTKQTKLIAIIICFGLIPAIAFYVGMEYQDAVSTNYYSNN